MLIILPSVSAKFNVLYGDTTVEENLTVGGYADYYNMLTKMNDAEHIYLMGNATNDGSIRFSRDPDTNYTEIETMVEGVWQLSSFEVGSNTLWIGKGVGLAGAGHHLVTEDTSRNFHFLGHSHFDGNESTKDLSVAYVYNFTERQVFQPDNSNTWTGTSFGVIAPSPTHTLVKKGYLQTGATAATQPVRIQTWIGTNDTGTLIFDQWYPTNNFPALSEVEVEYNGYLEFSPGLYYFTRYSSDESFSLKTNAGQTFPWVAIDSAPMREDNLLQTAPWENNTSYPVGQYLINNRTIMISNDSSVQTVSFENNSDKWYNIASKAAMNFWTKIGNLLSFGGNVSIGGDLNVSGDITANGDMEAKCRLLIGSDLSTSPSLAAACGIYLFENNLNIWNGTASFVPRTYGISIIASDQDVGDEFAVYFTSSGYLNMSEKLFCDSTNDVFAPESVRFNVLIFTSSEGIRTTMPITEFKNSSCVYLATDIFGSDHNITQLSNINWGYAKKTPFSMGDNGVMYRGSTISTYNEDFGSTDFGSTETKNVLRGVPGGNLFTWSVAGDNGTTDYLFGLQNSLNGSTAFIANGLNIMSTRNYTDEEKENKVFLHSAVQRLDKLGIAPRLPFDSLNIGSDFVVENGIQTQKIYIADDLEKGLLSVEGEVNFILRNNGIGFDEMDLEVVGPMHIRQPRTITTGVAEGEPITRLTATFNELALSPLVLITSGKGADEWNVVTDSINCPLGDNGVCARAGPTGGSGNTIMQSNFTTNVTQDMNLSFMINTEDMTSGGNFSILIDNNEESSEILYNLDLTDLIDTQINITIPIAYEDKSLVSLNYIFSSSHPNRGEVWVDTISIIGIASESTEEEEVVLDSLIKFDDGSINPSTGLPFYGIYFNATSKQITFLGNVTETNLTVTHINSTGNIFGGGNLDIIGNTTIGGFLNVSDTLYVSSTASPSIQPSGNRLTINTLSTGPPGEAGFVTQFASGSYPRSIFAISHTDSNTAYFGLEEFTFTIGGEANTDIRFRKAMEFGSADILNSGFDMMFINGSTGHVGIGTSNPIADLDMLHTDNAPMHIQLAIPGTENAQEVALDLVSKNDPGYVLGDTANSLGWKFLVIGDNFSNTAIQNDLGIVQWNGSEWDDRLWFDSDTGNVGIGTNSPTQKLEVDGNVNISGDLVVETNALVVDSTYGYVGIGIAIPTATLDVHGIFRNVGSAQLEQVQITESLLIGPSTTVNSLAPLWTIVNDLDIALSGNVGSFNFETDLLSLDSSNNHVGIGTDTPSDKLEILDTTGSQLRLAYDNNSWHSLQVDSQGDLSWTARGVEAHLNFDFTQADNGDFSINSDDFFVKTNSNRVGIGTNSPRAALDVVGSQNLLTGTLNQQIFADETGLSLHIPMTEINGTTQYDRSPEGTDVVLSGGEVSASIGKYGAGLSLNGVDEFGTITSANLPSSNNVRTFEALVLADNVGPGSFTIFSYGTHTGTNIFAIERTIQDLRIFTLGDAVSSGTVFNTATWHFIQVTYNGTHINAWMDGLQVITDDALIVTTAGGTDAYVGRDVADSSYWNGDIDFVRMYDRVLSEDELRTSYLRNSKQGEGAIKSDNFKVIDTNNDIAIETNNQNVTIHGSLSILDRIIGVLNIFGLVNIEGSLTVEDNIDITNGSLYQGAYGSDDGLVLSLPFSEPYGTTQYDRSPYGYDSTQAGGVTCNSTNGKYGNGCDFDGWDGYIDVDDNFADFEEGMTIEVWAYPTSTSSWARFIDFGNGDSNDNIIFAREAATNNLFFETYNGTSKGGIVTADDEIELNKWQHFIVTLNPLGNGNGTVIIYKDGIQVGNGTTNIPQSITRTNNYIGKSNWAADSFYQGRMDEMRIYDRALSADEIRTHYLRGSKFNSMGTITADKFRIVNTTGDVNFKVNSVGDIYASSLVGSYTSGSAHVCVYNNGTLFASESACP